MNSNEVILAQGLPIRNMQDVHAIHQLQMALQSAEERIQKDTLENLAKYFDVLDETYLMTPPQIAASIRRRI